jgi:hypothetical protein
VFKALERKDIIPRQGQFILVAAGPGTGKSAFTLAYALKSGLPTLYFSADSDAFDQLTRSISILTGWELKKAKEAVLRNDMDELKDALGVPIRFDYNATPTLDNIESAVNAYEEVYGEYPQIIIVDNVTNVDIESDGEEGYAGLEGLMEYLHSMARNTGACVFGLHHVNGEYNNADKPIPLNGVKGQISRVPQMILTIFKLPGQDDSYVVLCISAVKNRGGKPDPSGQTYSELEFFGDTMTIKDPDPTIQVDWQAGSAVPDEYRRWSEELV